MTRSVFFAGAPSGGHLFPGLALAGALRREWGIPSTFLRVGTPLEETILAAADVDSFRVPSLGARGLRARWRAWRTLRARVHEEALAVIGLGGAPGALAVTAAASCRRPAFLLEQNRVLGRANRLAVRAARRVFLSFPDGGEDRVLRRRALRTGCPVRAGFAPAPLGRHSHLLVCGGSQGAETINRLMVEVLPALARLPGSPRVTHIAGPDKAAELRRAYRDSGLVAEVAEFVADPAETLRRATLVVARAGGSTVAELAAMGRPAIFIPYPHHRDRQQFLNADALASVGAAVVVDPTADALAAGLTRLLPDRAELTRMAARAALQGRPDAASVVAEIVATHLDRAATGRRLGGAA